MKSDERLQEKVLDELAFDPAVRPDNISVAVRNGVVTLRGSVASYAQKLVAEQAAKRVSGVHAIADELSVELLAENARDDADIARAVTQMFSWDVTVPQERVTASVDNGWVTLEGEVDWQFEIESCKRAAGYLTGVRGLTNRITLRPHIASADIQAKLADTFERNAEIQAGRIQIEVYDGGVTLRGEVHSWNEHDDATRAAYSLPGVKHVENLIHVV